MPFGHSFTRQWHFGGLKTQTFLKCKFFKTICLCVNFKNITLFKDKFDILQLKPCFKIDSDEIEWLRLFFRQMLLAREFSVSVVVVVSLLQ